MNKYQCLKISDLCQLTFGQHFQSTTEGVVQYLQVKNFSEEGLFLNNVENFVAKEKIKQTALLSDGDILFVGKGMKFFAYKYDNEIGEAIASSVFFVIKPDETVVDPDYLVCLLNQPKSLSYFYGASAGSSIPSIRKKELLDFQVSLPSLIEQRKIANYYNNYLKQQKLLSEIKLKNQILFHQTINKLTQENQ